MKIGFGFAAVAVTAAFVSTAASALTLTLDSYTASSPDIVHITSTAPVYSSDQYAVGFNMYVDGNPSDSLVTWCLDITNPLMSVGQSGSYSPTTTPYDNSYGLTATAMNNVQNLFDAVYPTLVVTDADQAAAFQLALWEAAFETSGTYDLTAGSFQGFGYPVPSSVDGLAATYLSEAASYDGGQVYNLTYLQSDGSVERNVGQNLVTVSPVPLPAGGLLLLTALGGLGVARRRRRKAA